MCCPLVYALLALLERRSSKHAAPLLTPTSLAGFVASIDDYYVISGPADLTVIETSLSVYDKTAYAALTPNCLFCYMRSMVANMLAGSSGAVNPAEEWTEVFAEHASGTYNNQWMVLDRSRVGQTEGLFWVLEEAPGVVVAMDQTATLISDGYWPSFNVAYYSAVRNVVGEIDSYTAAPRAELFRELQVRRAKRIRICTRRKGSMANEEQSGLVCPKLPAENMLYVCGVRSPTCLPSSFSSPPFALAVQRKRHGVNAHCYDVERLLARSRVAKGPVQDDYEQGRFEGVPDDAGG